jgi:transposase InsO family protein
VVLVCQPHQGAVAVTFDDVVYRYRLRALALAGELGNVRAACRVLGIHPSTYYRWRNSADRHGLELLRPRERRSPRMPNQASPLTEQQVLAFSLAHPGFGPARIAAELARSKWGGLVISPNGVWGILRRHGISTRPRRYALVAGYAAPPEPVRPPAPVRHIAVAQPGELVQMDCFYVGRLTGTRGVVWQYTAIDAYSAYLWGRLYVTPRNPSARYTSLLAHAVCHDLAERGWTLDAITTDNGSEFTSRAFTQALERLDITHRRIHAGRPQSNGHVERAQRTILEECWRPAFAHYLTPKLTGLRRDLDAFLTYYNTDRAHNGRHTKGRTPETVLGKAAMWEPPMN